MLKWEPTAVLNKSTAVQVGTPLLLLCHFLRAVCPCAYNVPV